MCIFQKAVTVTRSDNFTYGLELVNDDINETQVIL